MSRQKNIAFSLRSSILCAGVLSLIILVTFPAYSQPSPCGPVPDMTPFCIDACVICDIDGYTGINNDNVTGQAPPGFCTTQVHHMQWIAFIAGSTNLTITVKATNCVQNQGLEVGIYESLDCQTFNLVTNCDTDIQENETGTFINTVPLVVGQYYYFVMDGSNNDICNYTINVVSGSTMVPPLPPTQPIIGPAETCLFSSETFFVPPVTGANFYQWELDGVPVGIGPEVPVTFNTPGTHTLCVTAYNVCDTAAPYCTTILVHPNEVTNLTAGICDGDFFPVGDTIVNQPGVYTFDLNTIYGCDSTVNVSVSILPVVTSNVTTSICTGDSLYVGDTWYLAPGTYTEQQKSYNGCDSLINLILNGIICEMQGNTATTPVQCKGASNGSLQFSVLDGTPPFSYSWKRINGFPNGSGNLATVSTPVIVPNLPPGTYIVTVNDQFGNDVVLSGVVGEPAALESGWEKSAFNGYNISCSGASDGMLSALPAGGTPPYSFLWSTGQSTASIAALAAGNYALTLTDSEGCTFVNATNLSQPDPLYLNGVFKNPDCSGYDTGNASVQSVGGSVAPYAYMLNNGGFGSEMAFPDLVQGNYILTVRDANGCTADTTVMLIAAEIPVLNIGPDFTVMLGCSEKIPVSINVTPSTVLWTPGTGLSCTDCLSPEAGPYTTQQYRLQVSSKDGCMTSDSITVFVDPVRDVFIPNVFSPDNDGVNDFFTVFAGKSVREVKNLQVWSRWGELVFEQKNFPPNIPNSGWNGDFRGKAMPTSVYAWQAEIEYLDGVIAQKKGDVTIVR